MLYYVNIDLRVTVNHNKFY